LRVKCRHWHAAALTGSVAFGNYQASEGEAVVRSPTNMAATKIAAVDFNKMTSLCRRPAYSHVHWGRSVTQSTASNASAVLIERKKSREYLL